METQAQKRRVYLELSWSDFTVQQFTNTIFAKFEVKSLLPVFPNTNWRLFKDCS